MNETLSCEEHEGPGKAPLPEAPEPLWEGSARFQVVRRLGQGGMGVVYEALDRQAGHRVALTLLRRPTPKGILRLTGNSARRGRTGSIN